MAERNTVPVAVITGASEGLGLALAHEFARARHALLLVARTMPALKAVAQVLGRLPDGALRPHLDHAKLPGRLLPPTTSTPTSALQPCRRSPLRWDRKCHR